VAISKEVRELSDRTVERLKAWYGKAQTSRDVADTMHFLKMVFRWAEYLAKNKDVRAIARHLGCAEGKTALADILGALLRLAMSGDRRLLPRYRRALQYAASRGLDSVELLEKMERWGGISGCAERWSLGTANGAE
jgi:hypothetical protein